MKIAYLMHYMKNNFEEITDEIKEKRFPAKIEV